LIGAVDAGGGVCDFAGTDETFTLDDAVVLDIGEGTGEDAGGRLNVDTSSDILNVGKRGIVEGTCPVDGSTDGLNGTETTDRLE